MSAPDEEGGPEDSIIRVSEAKYEADISGWIAQAKNGVQVIVEDDNGETLMVIGVGAQLFELGEDMVETDDPTPDELRLAEFAAAVFDQEEPALAASADALATAEQLVAGDIVSPRPVAPDSPVDQITRAIDALYRVRTAREYMDEGEADYGPIALATIREVQHLVAALHRGTVLEADRRTHDHAADDGRAPVSEDEGSQG